MDGMAVINGFIETSTALALIDMHNTSASEIRIFFILLLLFFFCD
jgi:hypothetical protein